MDNIPNNAVQNSQTAATDTTVKTNQSAVTDIDLESKYASLEAENKKLLEEKNNYKTGLLKEKAKNKRGRDEEGDDNEDDGSESLDEKMARIAQETLSNSRLAEIAREQNEIIQKALKENKELKAAQVNRSSTPSSMGSHTENRNVVQDTTVTPEQMSEFKKRGWSDRDIERYKTNLKKRV